MSLDIQGITKMGFMENQADLYDLLAEAEGADLGVLVDYITDNGAGRFSLKDDVCARLTRCRHNDKYTKGDRKLIATEIRLFGGNTLVNLFRGEGIPYRDLLEDVASHLKVPFRKNDTIAAIELGVLQTIFSQAWEKMTDDERTDLLEHLQMGHVTGTGPAATAAALLGIRAGGFAAYRLSAVVANSVARTLIGRGIPLAANAAMARTFGVLLGPIGWVVTGLWSIADLASPAYRVTVPCVIQIAYIRQKTLSHFCPSCQAPNSTNAKFCEQCGSPMTSKR